MLDLENFESALSSADTALVMFFAPWCGHCKRAKPEFSSAGDLLANDKKKVLAAVDCTVHRGTVIHSLQYLL